MASKLSAIRSTTVTSIVFILVAKLEFILCDFVVLPVQQEEQIVHYSPPPQHGGFDQQFNIPAQAESEPTALSAPSRPSGHTQSVNLGDESVAKRFNYVDLELLEKLFTKSGPNVNVLLSPASIKATLGMILEGAKGNSAAQIANLLRIPVEQKYVRDQLKQLLYDISEQKANTQLYSANGVFVSDKLKLIGLYRKEIQDFYKALITPVNYDNVEQSVNKINQWVTSNTRGLITRIIGPEYISREFTVLLANAVYFKSIWKYTFDPTLTSSKCFYHANGECQEVSMMQNTAELNYRNVAEINAHALELPYSDDYAMLVLVPQVRHSMTALLHDLQHVTFDAIIDQLRKTEVTYEIPKFNIEYNAPLRSVLETLEVRDIFNNNANLSGIVQGQSVRVDDILHKAVIEVNEQGTIAASTTAAVVIPLMGSSTPHIVANHPFAFFIYKRSNRNIIFEGIVNNPQASVSQVGTEQQTQAQPQPQLQHIPIRGYNPRQPILRQPGQQQPRKWGV